MALVVKAVGPGVSQKALVRAGHLATLGLLVFGTVAGMNTDSINSIWIWMQLGLAVSMLLPNVLR